MKILIYHSIAIMVLVAIVACESSERNAGCDVNGVWLGRWQIDGGEGGTFIAPVYQDETRFDGNVFIWFDLPNLENHGVDFSGRIRDKEVRALIDISGVEIAVNGNVVSDSVVNGNFEVSIGLAGSYEGRKIELKPLSLTEIYRISNSNIWYENILCVNNSLWLSSYSSTDILVISAEGESVGSITGNNFTTDAAAFDGEHIWTHGYNSENGGYSLFRYDTLGNMLNSFPSPSNWVDALTHNGTSLYLADNYSRIVYELDASCEIIDSISAAYNSIASFVTHNNKIIFTPGYVSVLYSMTMAGEIETAYQLPVEHIKSITTNNKGDFWCLTEIYNYSDTGPGTSDFIIYTFTID